MKFIMTNDVESHSFESNSLDDSIAGRIENEAMPKLLSLHKKHKVKATFILLRLLLNLIQIYSEWLRKKAMRLPATAMII
jgi:hypothetical protein